MSAVNPDECNNGWSGGPPDSQGNRGRLGERRDSPAFFRPVPKSRPVVAGRVQARVAFRGHRSVYLQRGVFQILFLHP